MMYAKGFLPTTKNTHKTIVDFTGVILGQKYDTLISKFNRLRKQRHNFIYESENGVTLEEANSAIETAKELLKEIKNVVNKLNPQGKMFRI